MALLLLLLWSVAQTEDDTLTRTELGTLASIIRHAGYPCTQPKAGVYTGILSLGVAFKIECETAMYQVILTPNDTFRVQPWEQRLE
jgi:hypothetical protein